ncbi:enoyl-CoA hydratase-related protein, partial [Flavobacteriaceae bacterium]|nr:enoyl-CoA hydratase-related protein [Flavobacteriaceae bacterium]
DGGASWLLARQVGYSRALEIATSGKKVTGQRCLELGLTNRIVAQDDILSNAQAWAEEFAVRPTLAIGIAKEDMFFAMDHSLNEAIAFEAKKQMEAFKSHDLKEGVSAFIEKRKPNFLGK